MSQVHARARTTPLIRTEIRESELGVVALAEHYNITRGTASKWKNREDVQDRSHRPHKLSCVFQSTSSVSPSSCSALFGSVVMLNDVIVISASLPRAARPPQPAGSSRAGLTAQLAVDRPAGGNWPRRRF